MSKLLTGSIDLSKIDKSKLFTAENGKKYLNVAVWINDEKDKYNNDASIQQSTKKDEPKIYIGNLKFFESVSDTAESTTLESNIEDESDDLPF